MINVTNLDTIESNALFISKVDGQLILNYLKDLGMIPTKLKIDKTDNEIIIPLESKIDLNSIEIPPPYTCPPPPTRPTPTDPIITTSVNLIYSSIFVLTIVVASSLYIIKRITKKKRKYN